MKDTWSEAKLTENLRAETSKSLAMAEQKNKELTLKLAVEDKGRKSVEVGLNNGQAQVEKQCKKLHYTEIELAMANQQVVDLKAELEKAKEATQEAYAVVDALGQKFYDLGV